MVTHEFGTYLAQERKRAGYTLRALASRAQTSSSTLSRYERGHFTPARDDVERLDEALGAGGRLLNHWERLTAPSALPEWMRDSGRLQEAATHIEYLSPVLIPGLLQAPSYAHTVFCEGQPITPVREIRSLVKTRCERLGQLRKLNDPEISAVFPTTALKCVADDVRREQAEHLLSLDRVSIHLVPDGYALIGVTSPLVMVRLLGGGKAASSDWISGNVVIDERADIDRLQELVKRAYAVALPPSQSRKVLEELR